MSIMQGVDSSNISIKKMNAFCILRNANEFLYMEYWFDLIDCCIEAQKFLQLNSPRWDRKSKEQIDFNLSENYKTICS